MLRYIALRLREVLLRPVLFDVARPRLPRLFDPMSMSSIVAVEPPFDFVAYLGMKIFYRPLDLFVI